MPVIEFLADFFAGIFLCNAIPHLAAGLRGESFPTPFASPPGKGLSSPVTNVGWGVFNLIVGCALYAFAPFGIGINLPTLLFFVGFLLIGLFMARHFGKVRN